MNLASIQLNLIEMNLKKPFENALGVISKRQAIIIAVKDKEGRVGYGECVAFSTPWYTEETVATCYHILKEHLIPILQKHVIQHPKQVLPLFSSVRRNRMAKAAIETSIWDLYAKQMNQPLWKVIGGVNQKVPAGVVVGTSSVEQALAQINEFVNEGYQRVKVKISPVQDYEILKKIRENFPKLELIADANSSYDLEEVQALKRLDDLDLLMIEQPLDVDDIVQHRLLQQQLKTPICLDESIGSLKDVKNAHELGSCSIINVKIGRVGGLQESIAIHDYCVGNGMKVWCGGMLEFGISRAHNLALSSLPGFTIPGDISSSSRYWDEDIILPEIVVKNGSVSLSCEPGIGVVMNTKRLSEVTINEEEISLLK
ncbi:o-succinylbenzoate synthase [Bacillus spongiae]|uniref:o-succinylbenzoate synthase n=1 Tax=Bacillus spongiae TaxID=2683610 RepID=A0ABU8HHX7_9BACI